MQKVSDKKVDRSRHVWVKVSRNGEAIYKCVLCGGITKTPTDNGDVDRYEKLTADEKALCPDKTHGGRY